MDSVDRVRLLMVRGGSRVLEKGGPVDCIAVV